MGYEFFAYRYFLVSDTQTSLFPSKKEKEKVRDDIYQLFNNQKLIYFIDDRKYLFYHTRKVSDCVSICKLAKETSYIKNDEGEKDIRPEPDVQYPYIYIIVDTKQQIILLQKKSSVYRKISSAKKDIEMFILKNIDLGNFIFSLDEISNKQKFWDLVVEAEGFVSLELRLRSPNLFGARFEASKFLQIQKELYNTTDISVKFENKNGKLNVKKEQFETYIDYISAGAGNYIARYLKFGKIRKKSSVDNIKTMEIDVEPESVESAVMINKIMYIAYDNEEKPK